MIRSAAAFVTIPLDCEHYFPATIRANVQANANAEMYDADPINSAGCTKKSAKRKTRGKK